MTTFSVTGHMAISIDSFDLIRKALTELLQPHASDLVGVSCIARGSDTLFAEVVLELGGKLVVIMPSRNYRERKVKPDHAPTFDRLLEAASEVLTMDHDNAGKEAYESANRELIRRANRMVAVWNGSPPTGKGGTADTIIEARAAGVPVDVIWPAGASLG